MTKSNNQVTTKMDPRVLFGITIKNIKSALPSECTFLAPYKNNKGEYLIKAIVGGDRFYYTTPENLIFTQADIDRLTSVITEKCEEYVSKRN